MNSESKKYWNNQLLPCPFCGGVARLDGRSRAYLNGESTFVALAYCAECHARTEKFKLGENSTEARTKAVNAWNRRTNISNEKGVE